VNDPNERLSITLSRKEWRNLVTALRRDIRLQPQLGRLAWMTVGVIEGAVAGIESQGGQRAASRVGEDSLPCDTLKRPGL